MSTAKALQLCPDLVLLPVQMNKYREVSKAIHTVFAEYTSLIEPLSLDEAFLDVTECAAYDNCASDIATVIREKIYQQQQLTASAGIAPNKFLAKIASDWRKPNGQFTITPAKVDLFIEQLPVNKIFGVGKVTAKKLAVLNITTCADLQKWELTQLQQQFGKFGTRLYYLARGIDERPVDTERQRKSISIEHTFNQDIPSLQQCLQQLPALQARLQQRLQAGSHAIKSLVVKIKFADFKHTTVEKTHHELSSEVFQALIQIGWNRYQQPVRLLGIGVNLQTDTMPQQTQLELY
jgi:DNA polymerase-4